MCLCATLRGCVDRRSGRQACRILSVGMCPVQTGAIGRAGHGIVGFPDWKHHPAGVGVPVLEIAVDQVVIKRVIPSASRINLGREVHNAWRQMPSDERKATRHVLKITYCYARPAVANAAGDSFARRRRSGIRCGNERARLKQTFKGFCFRRARCFGVGPKTHRQRLPKCFAGCCRLSRLL